MDATGISSIVSAGTGLISGISGLFQKAKARKMEKENIRPIYNIPQTIKDNLQLAQQQSTMGLNGTQYTKALQNIDRSQNASLGAAQDRRGGLATIGAIQQGSNDAGMNLAVADQNQRLSNMRNLMSQNQTYAQYLDKQFDWNQKSKYEENAAAIRALKGAGNANLNAGLNGIIGGAASFAMNSGGGAASNPNLSPAQEQWGNSFNSYRGITGSTAWDIRGAMPYNDFKIPRY